MSAWKMSGIIPQFPGLLDSDLVNSSGVCGLKAKDSQILAFEVNSEFWAMDWNSICQYGLRNGGPTRLGLFFSPFMQRRREIAHPSLVYGWAQSTAMFFHPLSGQSWVWPWETICTIPVTEEVETPPNIFMQIKGRKLLYMNFQTKWWVKGWHQSLHEFEQYFVLCSLCLIMPKNSSLRTSTKPKI